QRRCFCNKDAQTPPGRCNTCEANSNDISNWSIPDFVNNQIIIDSKAVAIFSIDEQIRNFIAIAEQTNRPLWIFVRHDKYYTQETLQKIEATGGGIVDYFVINEYRYLLVIEQSMNNILIGILIFAGGVMIWQFISLRSNNPPQNDDTYYDEVDDIEETIEETEEFIRRMERLSKREDDNKKK
ncbi:MAG: hypothetical protein WBC91_04850, partial [Phototrophicaceae bacterium]